MLPCALSFSEFLMRHCYSFMLCCIAPFRTFPLVHSPVLSEINFRQFNDNWNNSVSHLKLCDLGNTPMKYAQSYNLIGRHSGSRRREMITKYAANVQWPYLFNGLCVCCKIRLISSWMGEWWPFHRNTRHSPTSGPHCVTFQVKPEKYYVKLGQCIKK